MNTNQLMTNIATYKSEVHRAFAFNLESLPACFFFRSYLNKSQIPKTVGAIMTIKAQSPITKKSPMIPSPAIEVIAYYETLLKNTVACRAERFSLAPALEILQPRNNDTEPKRQWRRLLAAIQYFAPPVDSTKRLNPGR
jgi:hypothetical protein